MDLERLIQIVERLIAYVTKLKKFLFYSLKDHYEALMKYPNENTNAESSPR